MFPTLIFLHIPKTAGTSFKSAMVELLPPERVLSDRTGIPFHEVVRVARGMDPAQRAKLQAVVAHQPYGLHALVPDGKYVTILREPVARLLSAYYFLKTSTGFELCEKIAAGMTVEEFATDVFNDNAQVRWLMKYPDISRADVFSDPPAGQLTRTHLEDAKDTLRRCAVVGLAERYEEFLDCVSAEFGLPPIPCRDDNVTAIPWHREPIPERTIERLLEMNELDRELYEYAAQLAAVHAGQQKVERTATHQMRPLYVRTLDRDAWEAENKRLEAEGRRQQEEVSRLRVELSQQQEEKARLQATLGGTVDALRHQLNATYSSRSWKITAPLRRLTTYARKLGLFI